MNKNERKQELESRINQALNPTKLEIIDESHKHVGHAGAAGGASHFFVSIAADELNNLSHVQQHRKIYQAVGDMIPEEIHALRIEVIQQS